MDKVIKESIKNVLADAPRNQYMAELSYGDRDNENLLIQGDNLEAPKALIDCFKNIFKQYIKADT